MISIEGWTSNNYLRKNKKARLEQFLMQKQMAEELRVSMLTIIYWENGRSKPSLDAQKKFHDYCKNKNISF